MTDFTDEDAWEFLEDLLDLKRPANAAVVPASAPTKSDKAAVDSDMPSSSSSTGPAPAPALESGPGPALALKSGPGPAPALESAPAPAPGPCSSASAASSHPDVVYRLPRLQKAGKVLAHCCDIVNSALALYPGCVIFTIGITSDPVFRYTNQRFGYQLDGYQRMVVMCETSAAEAVGFVEAALLLKYMGWPGCQNSAPGGENLPRGPRFLCYIVYRVLPRPPGH